MDKAKQFVVWLDGFLEGHVTLNEDKTTKLMDKLDGIFDHSAMDVITVPKPTLEELGEQYEFPVMFPQGNGIHGEGPDGELMRC